MHLNYCKAEHNNSGQSVQEFDVDVVIINELHRGKESVIGVPYLVNCKIHQRCILESR